MGDEYKVQISLSLPPAEQYHKGDMLNIRAADSEELEETLKELRRVEDPVIERVLEYSDKQGITRIENDPDFEEEDEEEEEEEERPRRKKAAKKKSSSKDKKSGPACVDCGEDTYWKKGGKRKDGSTYKGFWACPEWPHEDD